MYLINKELVSGISSQISPKDVTQSIDNVTFHFVKKVLNDDLYALLLDHFENDTELNTKQQELYSLVKRYMNHLVRYDLMFENTFSIVSKNNEVNDKAASEAIVEARRNKEYVYATSVKEQIIAFLEKNLEHFPEYIPENRIEAEKRSNGNSPILFDNEPKIWIRK